MSDVRDRVFGPCQTCLRPICQCPAKHTPTSDTQAMTQWIDPKEWQNREGYGEAEAMWKRLKGFPPDFPVSLQCEFQPIDKLRVELLTFSAAQRETIRQQAQEIRQIQKALGCHRAYIIESINDLKAKTEDIPNIDRIHQAEQEIERWKAEASDQKAKQAACVAELAASEAMVKEMEQACDQRKLTRKQQIEFDKIIGSRDREINTLRDRLARKTLKWTTERPTVAGMYWCDEYGPDIVRVRMHGDKLGVCISSTWYPIDSFTCRWQGPLTPGEE